MSPRSSTSSAGSETSGVSGRIPGCYGMTDNPTISDLGETAAAANLVSSPRGAKHAISGITVIPVRLMSCYHRFALSAPPSIALKAAVVLKVPRPMA
jgi:hypothetical protein